MALSKLTLSRLNLKIPWPPRKAGVFYFTVTLIYVLFRVVGGRDLQVAQFPDSNIYLSQFASGSDGELAGRERPWAYPLFLALLGHSTQGAVIAQRLVSVLAWITFAFALRGLFKLRAVRAAVFLTTLTMSLSMEILMWDQAILAESLTISLFLLTGACLTRAISNPSPDARVTIGLACLAIPFAGLRDSNNILLPVFVLVLVLQLAARFRWNPHTKFWSRQSGAWPWIGSILFLLLLFGFNLHDRRVSQRGWTNAANVISRRGIFGVNKGKLIVDQGRAKWFIEHHDMPLELIGRAGKAVTENPPPSPELEEWLKTRGVDAWVDFLRNHAYLTWTWFRDTRSLFSLSDGDLYLGDDKEGWESAWFGIPAMIGVGSDWIGERLYGVKRFNVLLVVALAILVLLWTAMLASPRGAGIQSTILLEVFLLMSAIIGCVGALLGDAMEDWRHAFLGLVAFKISLILFAGSAVEVGIGAWTWLRREVGTGREETP